MALAFGAAGAVATGTTPLSVPIPSASDGDLLVLFVGNKYPTNGPSTPNGWTAPSNNQFSGGAGAAGADSGTVYITVFVKIKESTDTGNLAVTVSSANTSIARIFSVTKSASTAWGWACAGGSDNAAGTSWSVTAGANPGITANDLVFVGTCVNGNTDTATVEAISATGATFGTMVERQDSGSNTGDDISLWITEHPVSSGTASAAPVYTATVGGTGSATAAGASLVLRLREVPNQTITCVAGAIAAAGLAASIIKGAVTVQAVRGTLAALGLAATISSPGGAQTVNASAGVLAIAGQTASVTSPPSAQTVQATAGAIVGAGQTADVIPGAITVQASAGGAALSGQTADVQPGAVVIQASAASAVVQGYSAGVSTTNPGININCTVGALSLTGLQAAVQPGRVTVAAQAGAVSVVGYAASVSVPGNVIITATCGAISLHGWSVVVTAAAEAIDVTGMIPPPLHFVGRPDALAAMPAGYDTVTAGLRSNRRTTAVRGRRKTEAD